MAINCSYHHLCVDHYATFVIIVQRFTAYSLAYGMNVENNVHVELSSCYEGLLAIHIIIPDTRVLYSEPICMALIKIA